MNDIINEKESILVKLEDELNRNRRTKNKINMEFIKKIYQEAERMAGEV
jgi:hypothetical protein